MTPEARNTSFRLPARTNEQLDSLTDELGMTRIQVVMMAIDRMYREEMPDRKAE